MKLVINMDLLRVERELKKRWEFPYRWGRKQSDTWDDKTNFIYKTYSFEKVLLITCKFDQELKDYAMNRWYNFWSAMAVEYIFAAHPNVAPNKNHYDKLVDFTINNISFDHKTSVFPRNYPDLLEDAQKNKLKLIQWLYDNQSQQSRKHLQNRLFVVLYDSVAHQHWKLKAEILMLQREIDKYVVSFSKENLEELNFGDSLVYSDIIFVVNKE